MRRVFLFFFAIGCATTPEPPPRTGGAAPDATAPSPWEALQQWGELDDAAATFERWRDGERPVEGLVGLMTVATVRGDGAGLRSLSDELEPAALRERPELLVRAALAAGDLRPLPPVALALGRAACELSGSDEVRDDEELRVSAREACALTALAEATEGDLDTCVAGCAATHERPLLLAGGTPVVEARVAGAGAEIGDVTPAHFIVDTGASGTLVTSAFAREHGIEPVPGSAYEVGSPGGLLEVAMAVVDVQVGELRVERVPAIIVDLPIEFVAGILSPQATWRGMATELDFRQLRLRVAPEASARDGAARLPLRLAERTPVLQAAIGGRRAVPVVLDTGATHTTLFTGWEALEGEAIERGPETRLAGAGGGGARAWGTRAELDARAGDLRWTVHHPTIAARGDGETVHGEVRFYGLVGMDLLMGRRLVIDLPGRSVGVSSEARLPAWPVGASAVYRVRATSWDEEVEVREEVVERRSGPRGEEVVVEVRYTPPAREGEPPPAEETRFRYAMPDGWATRGTWLISRPVTQMWDVGEDGALTEVPENERASRWLPVFVGFQARPAGNPRISFLPVEREGENLACTEIALPAVTQASPDATLELLECPAEVWRTRRLTLRAPDGTVIYELSLEPASEPAPDGEPGDGA